LRPRRRVETLSRAEQQMVEIAKAFRSDLSVLILDEPTASLTDQETEQLFALIEQIKSQGVGVIYITHRMQEIRRIGDRITVLRDGRYVATLDAKAASDDELVRLMTGRVISDLFPKMRFAPREEVLRIEELSTRKGNVRNASLAVRAGEIVGLAGLVGSGKSEVMRAVFGVEAIAGGRVSLQGKDVQVELPLAPWEAALGAKVAVPTLGGTVELTIPAGAQAGQKLRLRGRGFPGTPNGDQFVLVKLVTPAAETPQAKEAYERMRREFNFNPRAAWP